MPPPSAAPPIATAPLTILRLAPSVGRRVAPDPAWLTDWLCAADVRTAASTGELLDIIRRSRVDLVLLDGRDDASTLQACVACKRDAYTALTPCVVFAGQGSVAGSVARLLTAGADEVIDAALGGDEAIARVSGAVRRAARDRAAQPTTGLPGPPAIDAEIADRLASGRPFAACYADLDHFKEYNDRYGFHEGDRVIRLVARLLYDIALGTAGDEAFVGHIGGDDFLCVLPLRCAADACALIVETFDLIAPIQYSPADRRAGYYLGKDRRGQLHRVPLMTLSLGVATTERRRYESAADVSRLASEMKSFAKTLPGSVFAFDRRGDDANLPTAPSAHLE